MSRNRQIAVLLTCHNRREKTLKCLDSLFLASLPENHEINVFLVDDGSVDGTANAVKAKFPKVKVIQGNGSLFWTKGMYLAWESAKNEYDFDFYLWLNDDTFIMQNALEILLADSILKQDQSIICGRCKSKQTDEITYGGYSLKNRGKIINNESLQLCDYFNGNIVLIPRSAFQTVGNLDSGFVHCLGDYDYGLRAKKMSVSSWVTAESIAICDNNILPKWCNPETSLKIRLKYFYTPLGAEPFKYFIYANRHFGFITAVKTFVSLHFRVLFPKIWV